MAKAVVASASIPFIFPVQQWGQKALVDGGTLSNLDLSEAIVKCNEMGYKDEDIIVDMLMCFDILVKWDPWTLK